jgi:predicted deacylase
MNEPLNILNEKVAPGTLKEIPLKISEFFTSNPVFVPVVAIRGENEGPAVFITASIHGDEINGVEIVSRLIQFIDPGKLSGTLICVPIVNIFGFFTMNRYFVDRRDLNTVFPGNMTGSATSRVAKIIFDEIIQKCDFGIDIHTPRVKRYEIPHVEADINNQSTRWLAKAFDIPVTINTPGLEKSLQNTASSVGIPTIVYSGGEVLRFHESVTEKGLSGILNVLSELKMYEIEKTKPEYSIVVKEGKSVKTRHGGILYISARAGDIAHKGDVIAKVTNPFGKTVEKVKAPETGLLISISKNPLVNPGNEVCSYVKLDKSLKLVENALNKLPEIK